MAENLGFSVKEVSTDRMGMIEIFLDRPRMVFLNPISKGSVRLDTVDKIKSAWPKTLIILLVEEKWRDRVLDDPAMKQVNSIFLKPLDLTRLKEFIEQAPG